MINFNTSINKQLPISKRKVKIVALLKLLLHPLIAVNLLFEQFKLAISYKLQFNGQIIYLEHFLNDLYDPSNRSIHIEDVANIDVSYAYNRAEQQPTIIAYNRAEQQVSAYLNNRQEIINQFQFIVKVPTSVTFDEVIMRIQIDYYKIAGKQYKIETF